MTMDLADLTFELVEPHTGEEFTLVRGDERETLDLVEVSALAADAPEGFRRPFSMVFLGVHDLELSQGIQALENPLLGTLELFLVPIGHDERGTVFEAVLA
jgi:hypothetical protein